MGGEPGLCCVLNLRAAPGVRLVRGADAANLLSPTWALNNPSMQPETPPRDRDAKRLLPSIPMRPPAPPTHGVHARYGACQCVELGVVFLLGLRRERIRRPDKFSRFHVPIRMTMTHNPFAR